MEDPPGAMVFVYSPPRLTGREAEVRTVPEDSRTAQQITIAATYTRRKRTRKKERENLVEKHTTTCTWWVTQVSRRILVRPAVTESTTERLYHRPAGAQIAADPD